MEPGSRFTRRLGAITIVALAGRVAFVLAFRRHTPAWGDSFSFHYGANLLAQGKGFIDPLRYLFFGIDTPSAYHPPLYTVYAGGWYALGVTIPNRKYRSGSMNPWPCASSWAP